MQIGSRQAPRSASQPYARTSTASATPADFGAGVGTALRTLSGALSDRADLEVTLQKQEQERQEKVRNSSLEIEFLREQGQSNRRLMESRVNQEAGAIGYTNEVNTMLEETFDNFSQRLELSSEERDRFAARFETYKQGAVTSAYAFEFEETSNKLIKEIGLSVDEIREELRVSPSAFDHRREEITRIIDESPLPPTVKDELRQSTYEALATVTFGAQVEASMRDMQPAQEPSGNDVVAPGASRAQRAFANAITIVESGDGPNVYRRIYGDGPGRSRLAPDFTDHPRQFHTIESGPNKGKKSSAAGRYQFLAGTWDFVKRSMEAQGYDFGSEPFSPVNQDRAFWWYAQHRYRNAARAMGMQGDAAELRTVLESGNTEMLKATRAILAGETKHGVVWEGLQHMTDEEFISSIREGSTRNPLGSSQMPDVWGDERFAGLGFDMKSDLYSAALKENETRMEQLAQGRQEQEAQIMQQIRDMISQGKNMEAAAVGEEAIANGNIRDIANVERIRNASSEYREQYETAQGVQSARSQGIPTSDDAALNTEAGMSGVLEGIMQRAPEAAAMALDNFAIDGRIPSDIATALESQLLSSDPAQQVYALEMMASMYSANPRAAAHGQSREFAEQMALAATLGRFSKSPQDFIQDFNRMQDPATEGVRKQRITEARELFETSAGSEVMDKIYNGWLRSFAGVSAPSLADMPMFLTQAQGAFEKFYALFGDEKQATAATSEVLGYMYSPSPFTGRVQEFSPASAQMGVPTLEGTHDWVVDYTENWVDDFIDSRRDALSASMDSQGIAYESEDLDRMLTSEYDINQLDLLGDMQSLREAQNEQAPTYLVTYTDSLGVPRIMMDENMQRVRVPIEMPEEVRRAADARAQVRHIEERENRIAAERRRLQQTEIMESMEGGDAFALPEEVAPTGVTRQERAAQLDEAEASIYDGFREQISTMTVRELQTLRRTMGAMPDQVSAAGRGLPGPRIATDREQRMIQIINELLRERGND